MKTRFFSIRAKPFELELFLYKKSPIKAVTVIARRFYFGPLAVTIRNKNFYFSM
jgi:hypothetical protein